MIVVDANVMVMALSSPSTQGDAARAAMLADDVWIAPAHMPLEVLRTLRKAVLGDRLTAKDADAAVGALTAMQIEFIGTDIALLQAVWAMRHNVSVYDAAYLAIAATHDAPLVTFDARLAKAAEQAAPSIRVTLL
ncbi:type II toxin-antitoxin system VapC family toxin [Nocardia uniformis]|uniref:Ribonuclease VapC n=1 Tax=Nocardia uniformis TaxID=53432 RepID=A0A849C3W8_9NOCA|nr:type II toxin-antitoxin system VapC family toxin [Nocardia uniformis]NNH72468.1 type II toxin-antitoxin system VapC family toxin [Nocardia uniformis]